MLTLQMRKKKRRRSVRFFSLLSLFLLGSLCSCRSRHKNRIMWCGKGENRKENNNNNNNMLCVENKRTKQIGGGYQKKKKAHIYKDEAMFSKQHVPHTCIRGVVFFFSSLLLIWPDILLSSHILKANTRTQRGEGRGVWEGVYCSLRFCAALRWWLLPLPPFLPP